MMLMNKLFCIWQHLKKADQTFINVFFPPIQLNILYFPQLLCTFLYQVCDSCVKKMTNPIPFIKETSLVLG